MLNEKRQFNITDLLCLYILIYFTAKFLDFIPIFSIIVSGLFAVLIILFKSADQFFSRKLLDCSMLFMFAYTSITFLIYIIKINDIKYWNIIDNSIKIMILCVLCACFDTIGLELKKNFLRLSLLNYFCTMLSTLINVIIDPTALRATASQEVSSKILFGLSGYDFIYGLIILNIILTVYLAKKIINKKRILYILFIILNTFTITLSGYTTATIMNIIFIFIAISFSGSISKILAVALIGVLLLFPSFLPNIIVWGSRLSFIPSIISERLHDMAMFISGNSNSLPYLNDSGGRGERFILSLNLFLKHPLLGNFLTEKNSEFGEHTEWIDRLAQFGIIIVALVILFWYCRYKEAKKQLKRDSVTDLGLKISYLYFIVLGFLNPASYILTVFPLLFFVPNLHLLYVPDNSEK